MADRISFYSKRIWLKLVVPNVRNFQHSMSTSYYCCLPTILSVIKVYIYIVIYSYLYI